MKASLVLAIFAIFAGVWLGNQIGQVWIVPYLPKGGG
jgi:hypothetical protein